MGWHWSTYPPALRNDRSIVKTAVEQNGFALQHASSELQNDRSIVEAAVAQNGMALKFTSRDLQNNRTIITTALQQDVNVLDYVNQMAEQNRTFKSFTAYSLYVDWTSRVAANWRQLKDVPANLRGEKRIILQAIRQHGMALKYTPDYIRAARWMVFQAIQHNATALRHAHQDLQGDFRCGKFRDPTRCFCPSICFRFTKTK